MFCIISTHVGFYLFCLSFLNKTCNKKKRDIVKEKIVWLSRGYRTVLVNGFKIFNEVQVIFFIAIRDSNVKLKLVLLECLWNVFNKNRLNSSILDFSPLESWASTLYHSHLNYAHQAIFFAYSPSQSLVYGNGGISWHCPSTCLEHGRKLAG